jgi:hypothetical protein
LRGTEEEEVTSDSPSSEQPDAYSEAILVSGLLGAVNRGSNSWWGASHFGSESLTALFNVNPTE